jgi:hypothetical protein
MMAKAARVTPAHETGAPPPAGPRRRIILLFDGTWNDVELGTRDTSIVRLRGMIDAELRKPGRPAGEKTYVFYRRGVGTDGWLDRVRGGALGFGVDQNVRRGYRFLARHYQPGDEIYVFGFSRGAFTARSLVGWLGAAGLLTSEHCTPERERAAWAYYRTPPDDRLTGDWHALGPYMHPRERLRVAALCVFDTVGALGVPGNLFRAVNRQRYAFHNVEMPSITGLNLHAVAIDEQRPPFVATVWRQHKFKRLDPAPLTEQVWFPGVHADIGGGYFDAEARPARALDDIPLDWMLRRLKARFTDFPAPAGLDCAPGPDWAGAKQHNSRSWFYRRFARAHRAIANRIAPVPPGEALVGRDRHQAMVGEAVHAAAIERLGRQVTCGDAPIRYAPPVLVAALDGIAEGRIPLVGWDGAVLPAEAAQAAAALARARLASG